MPIRFRCAYCNQLMGISTRKAGTVVKCPKCAGDIIVPTPDVGGAPPDPEPAPEQPGEQATAGGALAEKDFEQYFHEAANGSAGVSAPAPTEATVPQPAPEPAPEPPLPPPRRGMFLSLPMLFASLAVIVLLLVGLFVAGFLLGRRSAPPPHVESKESA